MRIANFTLILCLFSAAIFAQEVISTAGDQTKNSTADLSWTIGEPIIETTSNGDFELIQGLHQNYLEVTAINEIQNQKFNINAFPNPATEYIELKIERESQEDLFYQLFDLNGRFLFEEQILNNKATIHTGDLLPAIYYLKINENQNTIQTFQIIKK